jgi:hypothetical protein
VSRRPGVLGGALAGVFLACAALAAPAPPDTSLQRVLGQLSDSTDRYFGSTAAPVDTAGLDTILSDRTSDEPVRGFTPFIQPVFAFNRVDGSTPGLSFGVEGPRRRRARIGAGRLGVKLAWAAGPDDLLGAAEYLNRLRLGTALYELRLFGGRFTSSMNRDHAQHLLSTARALVNGSDYTQYVRRDGWETSVTRDEATWRASLGWRDMLESPLPVTATWNLLHREPAVPTNLPAAFGRAREIELEAGVRLPFDFPFLAEAGGQISDRHLGSAFDYRRMRVAVGAELPIARTASLVPQFSYGRLTGDTIPQSAFYLGGGPTLRSLNRDSRGGTRMALAKLDLIGAGDLLGFMHHDRPSAFPIQGGAFVAAGAVWGVDPYGGPAIAGKPGPPASDWLTEAGVSLIYSSGLFDEGGAIRLSYAWPLGPADRRPRFTIGISRALDLLHPLAP